MRRLRLAAGAMLLVALTGAPALAQTLYVSPDVPTDPDVGFLLPWDFVRHDPGSATPYSAVLSVPGRPAVAALHRMDRAGNWLFSLEAPSDLGGALGGFAEPRDVVRFDAGVYSLFFCGGGLPASDTVPVSSSVDALYLDASTPGGGDNGDLIVSFDVPTTLGGAGGPTFQPSALVRFEPTGAGGCGDWSLVGLELDFASVAANYFPGSANVTGADRVGGGEFLLTLDIPTDLSPQVSGPPTFTPGLVVFFDPATGDFGLFDDLQVSGVSGWPISAHVDALSCSGNPGRLDPSSTQIVLDKVGTDLLIDWAPGGCSAGVENYGIYEGDLDVLRTGVYDHARIDCDDLGGDLKEQITPAAGNTYYVVVPYTSCGEEGSYGTDYDFPSNGAVERPPSSVARCVATQTLSTCP